MPICAADDGAGARNRPATSRPTAKVMLFSKGISPGEAPHPRWKRSVSTIATLRSADSPFAWRFMVHSFDYVCAISDWQAGSLRTSFLPMHLAL